MGRALGKALAGTLTVVEVVGVFWAVLVGLLLSCAAFLHKLGTLLLSNRELKGGGVMGMLAPSFLLLFPRRWLAFGLL